jgi:hypothetical protein
MPIMGATIIEIREMTDSEVTEEGWTIPRAHGQPVVLVLDNGTILYASQDHEGNGAGAIFGKEKNGECFAL